MLLQSFQFPGLVFGLLQGCENISDQVHIFDPDSNVF